MSTFGRMSKIFSTSTKEERRAKKAAERQAVFESDTWQHGEDFAKRRYDSYEAYVAHQAAKLDQIADKLKEAEPVDFAKFQERFRDCAALQGARSVLCLAARLGTEVKALHSLGYFAVGIDLNPGPDNPYVMVGDFHHLVFPDASIDAVYTNALDHAFDLEKIVAEVRRVLSEGGVFIVDIVEGFEEGFTPGKYEAMHWDSTESLIEKIRQAGDFTHEGTRPLRQVRRDNWVQAVFRKT